MKDEIVVLLGSPIDLHCGVHSSLSNCPPPRIRYVHSDCNHVFLFPAAPPSPARQYHWAELLDFGPGPEIVHSHKWPVLNRHAWVTDSDELQTPLICGRHSINVDFQQKYSEEHTEELHRNVWRRTVNMLTAYGHDSCRAVLFRSDSIARNALKWTSRSDLGAIGERFARKVKVLYPAQLPVDPELIQRKWSNCKPFRIVFCGLEYDRKNGRLCLELFSRLSRSFSGIQCIYIGSIPGREREQCSDLLQGIEFYESLPRSAVLGIFSSSHILFHPSKREGFGTVFLEAAAAAMAVVVAKGGEMSHVEEIFGNAGASFVDRNAVLPPEEPAEFERCLRYLIDTASAARTMGLNNYELVRTGQFSLQQRDSTLAQVYEESGNVADPLALSDLPYTVPFQPFVMTSRAVKQDALSYAQEMNLTGSAVVFGPKVQPS